MTSFKAHYDTLARIALELEAGDADLDRVLPLLEEARIAYDACKERLEAVRRVLGSEDADETLEDEEDDEDDF